MKNLKNNLRNWDQDLEEYLLPKRARGKYNMMPLRV